MVLAGSGCAFLTPPAMPPREWWIVRMKPLPLLQTRFRRLQQELVLMGHCGGLLHAQAIAWQTSGSEGSMDCPEGKSRLRIRCVVPLSCRR